jgi:exopolysaccharide biosynthesis polyprenyl glycosylphosphotransferase
MNSETQVEFLETSKETSQARFLAHRFLQQPAVLASVDLCLGFGCYLAAWVIRGLVPLPFTGSLLPHERWETVTHPWMALIATQLLFPYILGLFDDFRRTRYREIVAFAFIACLLQMLVISAIFFMNNAEFPRTVILLFECLNFLALCAWRFSVKAEVSKITIRVLVVGENAESVQDIIQEIEMSPWMQMRVQGVVLLNGPEVGLSEYPVLGQLEDVNELIPRHRIDEIVVASGISWKDHFFSSLSLPSGESSVRLTIRPTPFEMAIGRLRHINLHDTPLIELSRNPNDPLARFSKRAFDLTLSLLALVFLLPLAIPLALAIRLGSPGPIFYRQERVGYDSRAFKVIKFRTMIDGAEEEGCELYAVENDPRVTPFGRLLRRFRIDELPQIINVLKGEMSFVGPRPERPKFVAGFRKCVPGYNERHKVKPGITGLAQVRSYYETSAEKKLKYDLAYIYNHSFSLDLIILLQTIKTVLKG